MIHTVVAQLVKNHFQCRRPWFNSVLVKIPWRRDRLPTPVLLDFPCGLADKESFCSVGDPGSIHGLERSPGEGKGYLLQYSGLENSMDCIVSRVAKSRTELSDFYFLSHSQRLYHSQLSKSRCFSGILLLFLWSSGCCQFDLWFLCLFQIQLEHLEVLRLCPTEE